MPTILLDQRRVDALKPRKSPYDIRDRNLKGFGVRVTPSGKKRYFIHTQHQRRRTWKVVARAETTTTDEARARATAMLAAIRQGEEAPPSPQETLFEAVAEEVFRRYQRYWKPRTIRVNRGYYKTQILPWFRARQIADITPRDVQQWFASLHATPVAADRSAPVLSVIMKQAEVYGYRVEDSNPCKGIKRYRRRDAKDSCRRRSYAALLWSLTAMNGPPTARGDYPTAPADRLPPERNTDIGMGALS